MRDPGGRTERRAVDREQDQREDHREDQQRPLTQRFGPPLAAPQPASAPRDRLRAGAPRRRRRPSRLNGHAVSACGRRPAARLRHCVVAEPSSLRPVLARNTSSSEGWCSCSASTFSSPDPGCERCRPAGPRRQATARSRCPGRCAASRRSRTAARPADRPASGSAGVTSTVGLPISALSCAGVPSATIRPVVDDPNPVGQGVRLLQVLGGEEHGHALVLGQPGHLLPERRPALRVEARRRLVEKQDPRRMDQGQREIQAALHPTGVAADPAIGRLGQPDPLEQLLGASPANVAGQALERAPGGADAPGR